MTSDTVASQQATFEFLDSRWMSLYMLRITSSTFDHINALSSLYVELTVHIKPVQVSLYHCLSYCKQQHEVPGLTQDSLQHNHHPVYSL